MRFTSICCKGGGDTVTDSIKKLCRSGIYCFAVADGEGAFAQAGAELAASAIISEFERAPEVSEERASHCLWEASEAFKRKAGEEALLSGVTVSAAVLITDGETAVCSHIGNARVYKFSKGLLEFITNDHTEAMEKYLAGELKFENIRKSASSPLTRVISADSEAEPETDEIFRLGSKSSFIICTDGFWRYVEEPFMERSLKKAQSSKQWLAAMLSELEKNAPAGCGSITAAAIIM